MRRAGMALGTLAGLVLVILAVLGVVLIAPSGTWHATTRVPTGRSAVVIDPALASVLGPQITMTITVREATGGPVPLFAGRSRPDDAAAFVGVARHQRITGLDGARRLSARDVAGGSTMPRVTEADIWHSHVTGTDTLRQSTLTRPGAESVVIARTDGQPLPALDVRLAWTNPWWFWIPLLLLVSGLALLAVCREPGWLGTARGPGPAAGPGALTGRRAPLALDPAPRTPVDQTELLGLTETPGTVDPAAQSDPQPATRSARHAGRRRSDTTSGRRR
jgi:hypothetical protein